jgi:hypothetical protein
MEIVPGLPNQRADLINANQQSKSRGQAAKQAASVCRRRDDRDRGGAGRGGDPDHRRRRVRLVELADRTVMVEIVVVLVGVVDQIRFGGGAVTL